MATKSITVKIYPDGSSKVEANNFAGVGCKAATEAIELALAGAGGEKDEKKKPDFYATTGASITQRN